MSAASAVREGMREQLSYWSGTREHKSANVGLAREKNPQPCNSRLPKDLHVQKNTRHGHMEGRVRMALACVLLFSYPENFFQDCRSRESRLFQLGGNLVNFHGGKK